MNRFWKKLQTGVGAFLVTTLLVVPTAATARDRCDNDRGRQAYSDRSRGNYGYNNGYRNSGYQDYSNRGYRNDSYGYRNDSYGYRNDGYYDRYEEPRSAGKSAAIIGGSAAAGAAVGAMTGGGKGALIGGAIGGVGGLIYDRATRNNNDRRW